MDVLGFVISTVYLEKSHDGFPWDGPRYIYRSMNLVKFYGTVHVGKYTSPMDCMGMIKKKVYKPNIHQYNNIPMGGGFNDF